jgi:hypothetical protein
MNWPGLHLPTACAFRFSQPPGAFIRPEPAGLVSCRIRSWGHPPELSSSRAAVRCFQRHSPPAVRLCRRGFRVFLRARVRHLVQRFRLKTKRVALLGLFPSRVLPLFALARPSPILPSCGCPSDASGRTGSTSGSPTQRARLVSLETADPPGVCGLLVVMPARASHGFWSRLRKRPGFVTAP